MLQHGVVFTAQVEKTTAKENIMTAQPRRINEEFETLTRAISEYTNTPHHQLDIDEILAVAAECANELKRIAPDMLALIHAYHGMTSHVAPLVRFATDSELIENLLATADNRNRQLFINLTQGIEVEIKRKWAALFSPYSRTIGLHEEESE